MDKFLEQLQSDVIAFVPKLGVGIVILLAFWLTGKIAKRILVRIGQRLGDGKAQVFQLIGQALKVVLMLLGLITALGTMGINVTALVAALGLTGFALGFALKDALSNLLAGALILVYQPFDYGDRIRVGAHEGTIEDINLRYTLLKGEQQTHLIPNSKIFTNTVTILTPQPEAEAST